MRLATIPPEAAFLDTLAARWLAETGDGDTLACGLILLPTRRAARALAEAFLRAGDGRPMLLPRITAIGALDEAPLALAGALDLPPAVEPAERLAVLARLVLALPESAGGVRAADRAWRLARELATLLDDAARAEIDLPSALANAADGAHAEHWNVTLAFLGIVTRAWPDWLSAQGLADPAARQVSLLRAQAAAWRDAPPEEPVWAAGLTAGFPAIGTVLHTVARLPLGWVVFPGLDTAMAEPAWTALGPGHPQAGLRTLLAAIGARRDEVERWAAGGNDVVPAGRDAELAQSVRAFALPVPGNAAKVGRAGHVDELAPAGSKAALAPARHAPELATDASTTAELTPASHTPDLATDAGTPELQPAKHAPDVAPDASTPELVPARHEPDLAPDASILTLVPARHTPDLALVASTPALAPAGHAPELAPDASTPELVRDRHAPDIAPAGSTAALVRDRHAPDLASAGSTAALAPGEHAPDLAPDVSTPELQPARHAPDPAPDASTAALAPGEHAPDLAPTSSLPGPVPAGRAAALAAALLPAAALGEWRTRRDVSLGALSLLESADVQEEAAAVAMVLRDALETPGARAALVTPDRTLARRVSAELLRWGVVADDSAGEPLAQAPPAVFLRLLAEAVAAGLAPVPLLSLLKHPLAAAGMPTAACRAAARALEQAALRGPKPEPGLAALRRVGDAGFIAAIERCLEPLLRVQSSVLAAPATLLAALVEAAEALAGTDEIAGPARLWAHEEGEALAALLAAALPALAHLPDQRPATLAGLLEALLEGEVVRSRRALRGRDARTEHPRVFIWGLLEARLQTADVVVLGGLSEGVWPQASDPGPWMSRPMRARAGLDDPEARIGQAAHDFVSAACAGAQAVLSTPRRRDGAPAVPSRYVARLRAWLDGQGAALPRHPAASWAGRLDQPDGAPRPVQPPTPRPPAQYRPRRLSVTEIETLIADPYAIFARHVLRLRPLKPLEQATDAADYGQLVHTALQRFLDDVGARWPADATARLHAAMEVALREALLRPALSEWWAPRLHRIADWVAQEEQERRCAGTTPSVLRTEAFGRIDLAVAGSFHLVGRADRIDARADGTIAIFDYKTGAVPSAKAVEAGQAPQLPLEAAMAAAGAFGPEFRGRAAELVYWHLTGGYEPGESVKLFKSNADVIADEVDRARASLEALLTRFADPETPYLSQPHPGRRPRFPDYAHLARCAEWDAVDEP